MIPGLQHRVRLGLVAVPVSPAPALGNVPGLGGGEILEDDIGPLPHLRFEDGQGVLVIQDLLEAPAQLFAGRQAVGLDVDDPPVASLRPQLQGQGPRLSAGPGFRGDLHLGLVAVLVDPGKVEEVIGPARSQAARAGTQ